MEEKKLAFLANSCLNSCWPNSAQLICRMADKQELSAINWRETFRVHFSRHGSERLNTVGCSVAILALRREFVLNAFVRPLTTGR